METTQKIITTANAGNCSAYELRQELIRRGALDIEEEKINFKSMLKRLMVELVAEEAHEVEAQTQQKVSEANTARDEAKKERERKKQEALERSKLRQSNPDYFKQRIEANSECAAKREAARSAVSMIQEVNETPSSSSNVEEEEEADRSANDRNDPFRSYAGGRSKIFVK